MPNTGEYTLKWRSWAYLTSIMAFFTSGAKTAGGQNENLFGNCVDFPHAFVVIYHWNLSFANSQRNGSSYNYKKLGWYYSNFKTAYVYMIRIEKKKYKYISIEIASSSRRMMQFYTPNIL